MGDLIYNSNYIDVTDAQYWLGFLRETELNITIKGNCNDSIKEVLASTANNGNVSWE